MFVCTHTYIHTYIYIDIYIYIYTYTFRGNKAIMKQTAPMPSHVGASGLGLGVWLYGLRP